MLTRRQAAGLLAGACGAHAAQPAPYRIVDPHVHVWKRSPEYPWATDIRKPPERDATAEMLLEQMKANGVERTVIIQVIHYKWDNRYLADVLKRHSRWFRGVARVNPEDPASPDTLSQLTAQGFRGVRLSPAAGEAGEWIKGPLMAPLWKRCEELKVPMTVLAPAVRIPDVTKLIEKFPGLTVVIDHMADCPLDRPDLLAPLLALRRYPHVFVKISHTWSLSKQPWPYRDTWAQVKNLYDALGPQRLMWGTDWPLVEAHCGYGKALAIVKDEMDFLNAEDRSWILSRTVQRVWPFLPYWP